MAAYSDWDTKKQWSGDEKCQHPTESDYERLSRKCDNEKMYDSLEEKEDCISFFGHVDSWLSYTFYKHGKLVCRYRFYVMITSIILVLVTAGGVSKLYIEDDIDTMFTPFGSPSIVNTEYAMSTFKVGNGEDEFLPNRVLESMLSKLQLIYTSKDGGNILREETVTEILKLDREIKDFSFENSDKTANLTFNDLCMKWGGECIRNPILDLLQLQQAGATFPLTYPSIFIPNKGNIYVGHQLGKVETIPGTNVIASAESIILHYYLSDWPVADADKWETRIEEFLVEKKEANGSLVIITPCTSQSLPMEVKNATKNVLPRFVATFLMLMVFAVISLMTSDWVISKPFLGLCGLASAIFAIVSSVGTLSYCGFFFNEVVSMMPFLVIGMGVDNMFIMVAAWRQLSLQLPLEERMGRTFAEAAVSITITNLTDIVAFIVGATAPLLGMRMFCLYSGVAMCYVYIYQITFFGACMAYSGRREENQQHCLTFHKVVPKENSPNSLYRIFCAGGVTRTEYNKLPGRNSFYQHPFVIFFRDYYGPFIVKGPVKVFVLITYLIVLIGSIYGCFNITEGLKFQNLAQDFSPPWKFYNMYDKYQESFSPPVHVIFRDSLEYWNASVQMEIDSIVKQFEASEFAYDNGLTHFWVRHYSAYLQHQFPDKPINKTMFLSILERQFLLDPRFKHYSLDISFEKDKEGTIVGINASRAMLVTKGAKNTEKARELMLTFRDIADEAAVDVIAYSPVFLIYDQYVDIKPTTMKTLLIAMVSMFFVAFILIPHPVCAMWVTLCTLSIDTAVVGYMSIWGVSLDLISMINIILCIGFSIDFSAHITYAFVIGQSKDPNQRVVSALRNLGMPITQGALSSIIAIAPLATANVYIFRTFFKTLFLVMFFGALHGLLFLPVALSVVGKLIPPAKGKPTVASYDKVKRYTDSNYSSQETSDTVQEEYVELIVSSV